MSFFLFVFTRFWSSSPFLFGRSLTIFAKERLVPKRRYWGWLLKLNNLNVDFVGSGVAFYLYRHNASPFLFVFIFAAKHVVSHYGPADYEQFHPGQQ